MKHTYFDAGTAVPPPLKVHRLPTKNIPALG
jgi:hypothetical protein